MQAFDVAQQRRAEQAAVLATELGRTLVADLNRGGRCIQSLREHQLPCFMLPEPPLELQRAHGHF